MVKIDKSSSYREILREKTALVHLLHSVALSANEAATVEEFMQTCVDGICEYTGWPVGHIYVLSPGKPETLIPTKIWHLDDPRRFALFRKITEQSEFSGGVGLPGRVLVDGKPAWITDVTKDPNFPRAATAKDIGIKAGLAFPVLTGTKVVAVWEFFSNDAKEPDDALLMALNDIGSQLGRAIERKQAERELTDSKMRNDAILKSALDGIITINEGGNVLEFNPSAEKTFGYRSDEAKGKNIADLIIPPRFRDKHRQGLNQYLETGKSKILGRRVELTAMRSNGSEFPVEIAIAVIQPQQGQRFFTAFIRDITESKQVETTLRKAKEVAETASLAKTEFLANMSHELRTPLNSVIGFSDILMAETFGPLGRAEYVDYAKDINDSGKHLLALINDILDVSLIEADGLSLEESKLDIAMVVASCGRLIKERAERAGLEFEIDIKGPLPVLFADERRVKQVIINLLANAVKFTPRGGKVTLRVGTDEDGCPAVAVADTGIGIAPEDVKKAMSVFGQIDGSLARKYEGAGLGLPLSKKLTEMHGGKLEIVSKPGVGTTVTIRFPKERMMQYERSA
ncbi:MAG: hypothetical protein A3G18_12230 [Rhodospirillales bacterium RIFCSPLOWO2_12_FULL_58_28]|nr:MAG: hypothetical protein A3H92_12245 [Rhodospirillales bacterium RIFCSPLOWO2_02_FULL_58_16]OHC79632.1 MAG: hypothetical protein A3G18_12230 [Rhodospirillales bacterium RIFCSPLOWO2_12_FULL_58_28]